jgi:hypothetical protein
MSTNSNHNLDDKEIDLTMISKGIDNFFQKINTSIFKAIQFAIKHIVVLVILLIIGISLGVFLDQTQKSFDNEIIVEPNFGSTDYLYSKVELLQSKIKEQDTLFLKSIGISNPSTLKNIEIKPVIDVYKFVNNTSNEQNFALLKLMAEDGDIKKIVEEKTTSKNYKYHTISFKTKSKSTSKQIIEPLLNYFNSSIYYKKLQKEYIVNTKIKLRANELTISQINGILNSFSNKEKSSSQNDKLVYYNENTQLNDVIETKDKLVNEQGYLRIQLETYSKIIKENSSILNKENSKSINGKLKIILPITLILIYLGIHFFISFYKKQALKSKGQL